MWRSGNASVRKTDIHQFESDHAFYPKLFWRFESRLPEYLARFRIYGSVAEVVYAED